MAKRKDNAAAAKALAALTGVDALGAAVDSLTETVAANKKQLTDLTRQLKALTALVEERRIGDVRALTVQEFAKLLNLSRRSVERGVKAKRMPHHRMGGVVRFTGEDISQFKRQSAVGTGGDAEGET